MNKYHLRDMVDLLVKKKIIDPCKVDDAVEAISKYWKDKMALVWCVEDVQQAAHEMKIRCSKDKATDILHTMQQKHDASYGVNWDTIKEHLSWLRIPKAAAKKVAMTECITKGQCFVRGCLKQNTVEIKVELGRDRGQFQVIRFCDEHKDAITQGQIEMAAGPIPEITVISCRKIKS